MDKQKPALPAFTARRASRREFLRLTAVGGGLLVLQACGGAPPAAQPTTAPAAPAATEAPPPAPTEAPPPPAPTPA
ncbi:MAG TPA: hypothetical protein PKD53_12085, partial [Chloroflexaceae bacterium]|nr:hypothetical protein [Chloroflexaceae bacterium]